MPEVTVVLANYFPTHGNSARGAWSRHDYKDSSGQKYQTFENKLANSVYGFSFTSVEGKHVPTNQPIDLDYEDVTRGEYTNRVIKGVRLAAGSAAPTVAPVASQAPPTVSSGDVNKLGSPYGPVGSGADDRQVQIMRQSALERAIRWIGITGFEGNLDQPAELYGLSEEFLHYFQTGEYPGKSEGEFLAAVSDEFPDAA